jgi:peptide/nickel transport system substrate-binding protein
VTAAGSRVSAVALEPYAGYYGPKPALARLTFRYYANTSATLDAFHAGEVDGVARIAVVDQARAAEEAGLTLYTAKLARFSALFLNTRKDSGTVSLAEKQVRQALMYALDREKLVRDALAGQGVVADTPFIPDTWAYADVTRKYAYDPERARLLLRSAGYELATDPRSNQPFWLKDGEAIALTLLHADDPTRKAVAESVVAQWRTLGIQVVAQAVGRNLERDYLASRQFQVALVEVPLDGDPDQYTLWHPSQAVRGQNYTGYDSNEAGGFLEAARQTTDKGRRAELYRRFQELFAEDLPALPLYYPTYTFGVTSQIKGAQIGPLNYGSDRLRNVGDWVVAPAVPVAPAIPAASPTR